MAREHKLCKSRDNKIIAGVCGGLAKYFDIDSAIVRLGFILLTFATYAAMAIVYCLMWIILPNEEVEVKNDGNSKYRDYTNTTSFKDYSSYDTNSGKTKAGKDNMDYSRVEEGEINESKSSFSFGVVLIIIGFALFFRNMIPHHLLDNYIFPIGLLVCGICLIFASGSRQKKGDTYYYEDTQYSDSEEIENNVTQNDEDKKEENDNVKDSAKNVIITPIYEEDLIDEEQKKDVQIETMEEFHFEDNKDSNDEKKSASDAIILSYEEDNKTDSDIEDDKSSDDIDRINVKQNLDSSSMEDTIQTFDEFDAAKIGEGNEDE